MNQFKNEEQQLYNLKDDPREEVNLIGKHPEKAKQMMDELNRIRNDSSTR